MLSCPGVAAYPRIEEGDTVRPVCAFRLPGDSFQIAELLIAYFAILKSPSANSEGLMFLFDCVVEIGHHFA